MTVLTLRAPLVATLHVVVGATILALAVTLSLQAARAIEVETTAPETAEARTAGARAADSTHGVVT